MRKLIYLSIITLLITSSCKKETIEPITPPVTGITNFKSIKANENFSWKTSNDFALQVKGFASQVPITGTLKISSLDGKIEYFKVMHAMDQNLAAKFSLPIDIKEFMITYGSINKKYTTINKSIEFDFIVDNPE